jgi:Protein of unknown function (DUF2752)
LFALGVWALRTFDPNMAGSFFPPCLFHTLTGLYCPGCGLTRALHALVHFDLPRALAMNLLIVLSLPALGLMALHGLNGGRLLPAAIARVLFNGGYWIAALLMFGVLRNLPWFAWLAPGGLL